jgi:hypothetical protein
MSKAIGTLLADLPELAEHAGTGICPGTTHAASLANLLTAAAKAASLWPELNGSLRKFNPGSRWQRTADTIAGLMLAHWRRANSRKGHTRVGDSTKTTDYTDHTEPAWALPVLPQSANCHHAGRQVAAERHDTIRSGLLRLQ